jgi:hypothetical protein
MVALFALVAAIAFSLLITRIASHALTLTGLSQEAARFQARSAFTGVGFTTSESEQIVNHPLRRRIVMLLMLIGNAGVITVIATLIVTFTQGGDQSQWLLRAAVAAIAISALWFLTWNRWVDKRLSSLIAWGLRRWAHVDARDYAALLHLAKGYAVTELAIEKSDWLTGKTLIEADISSEGLLVLGIHRQAGEFIGTPTGNTEIRAGDTLLIYGRTEGIDEIDRRRRGSRGDQAHDKAVKGQRKVTKEEQSEDAAMAKVDD